MYRRHLRLCFEELAERLQVFKAHLVGYFAHGETGGRQLFLGFFDELFVNVLLGILPGERPQQTTQVLGRKMKFLRHVLHRGQPLDDQIITFKIVMK